MPGTNLFHTFKWIIGGVRNDTPPTVADGENGELRLNENSELLVSLSGGLAAQEEVLAGSPVPAGIQYRETELSLDDEAVAVPMATKQGYLIVQSGWEPMASGGQVVSIGAVAARSTELTVGAEYHIIAEEKCWISAGDVTVVAVADASYKLIANVIFPYVAQTDKNYISVIRDSADSADGLSICRVR